MANGFIDAVAPDPLTYQPPNTVVPVPAFTQNGDTMVTILATFPGAQTVTAGWVFGGLLVGFAADEVWNLYTRIAAAEPASYTWVNNLGSGLFHAACLTYRGTTVAGAPVGARTVQIAIDNAFNSPRLLALGAGATPVVDTTVLYMNACKDGFAMNLSTWVDEPTSTRRIVAQQTDPVNFPGKILAQMIVGDAYIANAATEPAFSATHTWAGAPSSHAVSQSFFVLGGNPIPPDVPGFGFGQGAGHFG